MIFFFLVGFFLNRRYYCEFKDEKKGPPLKKKKIKEPLPKGKDKRKKIIFSLYLGRG